VALRSGKPSLPSSVHDVRYGVRHWVPKVVRSCLGIRMPKVIIRAAEELAYRWAAGRPRHDGALIRRRREARKRHARMRHTSPTDGAATLWTTADVLDNCSCPAHLQLC